MKRFYINGNHWEVYIHKSGAGDIGFVAICSFLKTDAHVNPTRDALLPIACLLQGLSGFLVAGYGPPYNMSVLSQPNSKTGLTYSVRMEWRCGGSCE